MKHIVHITSVHKQSDVRIFVKECSSLVRSGFKVSLVVAGGKDEVLNGVRIYGVPALTHSRILRFTKTVKSVVKKAISLQADIYHLHDPELLLQSKMLLMTGAKVVFDAHEDLPKQILNKTYLPAFVRPVLAKIVSKIEKYKISKISGVVAATPLIGSKFLKINQHTCVVCNYPDLTDIKVKIDWERKRNEVCYIGGIFESRGAIQMLEAIALNEDVMLNLAGQYSPLILKEKLLKLKGWKNVIDWGFVDRSSICQILEKSKAGLVVLHPTANYIESLPVKMFEYMAAGIPVIVSDFPILKEIIDTHECGISVNPFNINEISNAIKYLIDNPVEAKRMGSNGRMVVEKIFNWNHESLKLIQFYHQILSIK